MKAITYTRASTKDQKISHDAQQAKIETFCQVEGMEIVGMYTDTASGADNEREGLKKAIAHAKKINAPIVILRIDRLSRRLSFFAALLEDPTIRFIFAETGMNADPFTLNIMACVAQQERALISRRTKDALAALKAKGVKLGNRTNLDEARKKSNAVCRAKGQATKERYAEIIKTIQGEGTTSIKGIARRLGELGIKSPRGKTTWSRDTVRRLIA